MCACVKVADAIGSIFDLYLTTNESIDTQIGRNTLVLAVAHQTIVLADRGSLGFRSWFDSRSL